MWRPPFASQRQSQRQFYLFDDNQHPLEIEGFCNLLVKSIDEIITFTFDMNLQASKIDIIQWIAQVEDKSVITKIKAIQKEETKELAPAQKLELDKRLAKYNRGEMKFKSWEETKKSIRKRAKNAAKF